MENIRCFSRINPKKLIIDGFRIGRPHLRNLEQFTTLFEAIGLK
jgi:hypothetical protein